MLKKLAIIGLMFLMPSGLVAQSNQVKIVALVLTAGDYSPSSDNIVNALEELDAQTLRVESANASELRSVLKRFASAALENDVAIVFTDGPVLKLGDREFLAPAGMDLRRSSDLLTHGIPLSALARAAALASNGGAIFVHSADLGSPLPDGVSLAQIAPEARPGTSPVVLGQSGSAMAMAELFVEQSKHEDIDLNSIMEQLTSQVEFSVSHMPSRPVVLRMTQMVSADPVETTDGENSNLNLPQIISVEGATAPDAEASVDVVTDEAVSTTDQAKPLTIEMLVALQGGLTRAEKRSIQRGLRDLGFYSGLIDGIFGNQTKISIESYQESIDVEITGVLTVPQMSVFLN